MKTRYGWVGRLTLWQRLAIGMSVGWLLLFVTFSFLGELALGNSIDKILEVRLLTARMAASQFDLLLERHLSALSQIHTYLGIFPPLADPAEIDRALALAYAGANGRWDGILYWDASGHLQRTYPPSLLIYRSALPQGRPFSTIMDTFPSPQNDRPVVPVTLSLMEEDRILGYLGALVRLDDPSFTAVLEQAANPSDSGHALLVDDQGRVLVATLPIPFLAPGEHPSFYRQVIAQGQAGVEMALVEGTAADHSDDHTHAMAAAPLTQAAWAVAVGEDATDTFASVRQLRLHLILLSLATLGIVWAASLTGARRLVRPIQRLTAAAQGIAAGELYTPLAVSEGGEIGEMALALDRMRRQLLANIGELADLNEHLESRVAERTDALRAQQALTQQLLRRVITAQEEERTRLSQELHDEIGQTLTAVQISLDLVARSLPKDSPAAQQRIEHARSLAEQTLGDLRRVIAALRPGVLDRLGLAPALGWLADHLVRPLGMEIDIETASLPNRLPGEIETILFRIAQEAMNNVVRHSQATRMGIVLTRFEQRVTLSIWDNGRGFDPADLQDLPGEQGGWGLVGMAERAALAGGELTIESAPGQGTRIHVEIPLTAEAIPAPIDHAEGESTYA